MTIDQYYKRRETHSNRIRRPHIIDASNDRLLIKCGRCEHFLPEEDFSIDNGSRKSKFFARVYQCKPCQAKSMVDYLNRNPHKRAEYRTKMREAARQRREKQ